MSLGKEELRAEMDHLTAQRRRWLDIRSKEDSGNYRENPSHAYCRATRIANTYKMLIEELESMDG